MAENPTFSNSPVIADFDGDGRPDLLWLNNDSLSRAYLNRSEGNRVIVILPDSVAVQGTRVWLEAAEAKYTREVASALGLGTDQSPAMVFGLGSSTQTGRLLVSWPDGRQTVIDKPPLNRPIRIAGPEAMPKPEQPPPSPTSATRSKNAT